MRVTALVPKRLGSSVSALDFRRKPGLGCSLVDRGCSLVREGGREGVVGWLP